MMPTGTASINPGGDHGGLEIFVSQQLFDRQEIAGVRIKNVFCAEMSELMGRKCDSCSLSCATC